MLHHSTYRRFDNVTAIIASMDTEILEIAGKTIHVFPDATLLLEEVASISAVMSI